MATVYETIQDLGKIITDAVTAGNSNDIPARSIRKTLINILRPKKFSLNLEAAY